MKFKINHKQIIATMAGDIHSTDLPVGIVLEGKSILYLTLFHSEGPKLHINIALRRAKTP